MGGKSLKTSSGQNRRTKIKDGGGKGQKLCGGKKMRLRGRGGKGVLARTGKNRQKKLRGQGKKFGGVKKKKKVKKGTRTKKATVGPAVEVKGGEEIACKGSRAQAELRGPKGGGGRKGISGCDIQFNWVKWKNVEESKGGTWFLRTVRKKERAKGRKKRTSLRGKNKKL